MEPTTQKLVHTFGALADLGQEITDSNDFSRMVLTSLHLLLGALAIRRGAIDEYAGDESALKFVAARGLDEEFPSTVAIDDQARTALLHLELSGLFFLEEKARGGPFTTEVLEIISSMVRHIGVGIHTHRLLEQVAQRAE